MPFIAANNTRLFYRLEGKAELPVLVLSHSLGCDNSMWDPQMQDFLEHFRVLRYDARGHGASDVPKGDYSIDDLGCDALSLASALGIEQFAFLGLSMGGAVGQWLAVHAPEKLTALVLANTAPKFGTRETWESRLQPLHQGGMKAIADPVLERFFSPENRSGVWGQSMRSVLLATDPEGYAGCCVALRDHDHKPVLDRIKTATLVIGSDRDPSTPWEGHGEILAREISGAKSVILHGAHLSNLEQPRSFTAAVLGFLLDRLESSGDRGSRMRRRILGDEHVDRSISTATDFNRDFQMFVTEYVWGSVWSRPGLDARSRRLLTLAILSALGRWEEFRLHLRAAISHGMEASDVKECLMQVAVYAGLPAANTGFQIAREEMDKIKS